MNSRKRTIKYNLFIWFILFSFNATSQLKGDYNWQLGLNSNPIQNPHALSIELNFNEDKISIDTFYRSMEMGFYNCSYSNNEGQLLLYSNGCQIRSGHHEFIEGTNSLSPGEVDYEDCLINKSGYGIFDGGLFIPFFDDSIILLLHQRLNIEGPPLHIFVDSLFYTSVVKINNDYKILEKTIPIVGNYLTDGNVEAVKRTSTESWWVLQGERQSNRYFTILFDSAKVDSVFVQIIGDSTFRGSAAGQAVFSPDGNKYARYNPFDDLFLFDFDRKAGVLSNYTKLHVADSGIIGGLAFSPSGRFLYVSSQFDMYQFDTWDLNIQESKIHLGHYDGFVDPFPSTFYHMQLGPDCKIYMGSPNGIKVWHIIHSPDRKGLDCEFEQHAFRFPVSNSITMPNFPNYRLDLASACDPSITTKFNPIDLKKFPFKIFPNPATNELNVELDDRWNENFIAEITIIDFLGRTVFYKEASSYNEIKSIPIEYLNAGIYMIFIHSGKNSFVDIFVKY